MCERVSKCVFVFMHVCEVLYSIFYTNVFLYNYQSNISVHCVFFASVLVACTFTCAIFKN